MFTGLIQSKGNILRVTASGGEARFSIAPDKVFKSLGLGESIAVNGACLSVESFDSASFSAYASAETLRRTNLGTLRRGDEVNLERALRLGDSLGGHMVSGHVDCQCEVLSVSRAGSSQTVRFSCPAELARQIIPKGSVAVDGVSLTVNACGPDFFEVNVIPVTLSDTTVAAWKPGRKINLETDIIGKYLERMLGGMAALKTAAQDNAEPGGGSGLSLDFFRGKGF